MDSLLNFQVDLSSRISRSLTNFKKSSKERLSVKSYIEARLESLEQLWLEFLSGHKELMRSYSPKELKDTSYIKTELYDTTEDVFTDYKCILKQALEKFSSDHQSVSSVKSSQVKLPKINIPTFSGKYSEWSSFRDLFHSLVHTNSSLDDIQKLHYLKGYLTGEADQLLRHIPIVDGNYNRCWEMLEERYNNKRYICHHILQRLLGQKNIVNESANNLKEMMDTTNECLHALVNIGIDVKGWDVLIIHLLTGKLDPESRRQWEFSVNTNNSLDELPTFKQFEEFVTNRYRAIEFLEPGSSSKRGQTYRDSVKRSLHIVANIQCLFCSEEHKLGYCSEFAKETVDARRKFVETNHLCFMCLGKNHSVKFCQFKGRCRACKKKHHSLLHPNSISENTDGRKEIDTLNEAGESSSKDSSNAIISCFSSGRVYNHDLLATALVTAKSKNGYYTIRALLDQGSQSCFVTEAVVQLLGLSKIPVMGQISGLAEQESTCRAMVVINIESRVDPNYAIQVEAYVLKSITALLPAGKIEKIEWPELSELALADPNFDTPGKIDLLLGSGVYAKIIQPGVKKGPIGAPIAQATSLGWILSGEISLSTRNRRTVKALHCCKDDNELLKKFWELESEVYLPKEKLLKEEERLCENIFTDTTYRDDEGRYVVRLPFKTEIPQVSNSLKIAEKRLYALEKRLSTNKSLKDRYAQVMQEYIDLNHMELIPEKEINNSKAIYLPHHAVIREDKDTTKLRVVFDASCKGSNNMSLNDNLLVGPTLQSDLRHLVMRWRSFPICLTADIAKMYRQVKVDERDIDYQRILWRDEPYSETKHYRLLRLTFGTASAPYLAVKALQQLALDESNHFPLACKRVITDYYMDDLLTGCETIEEGIKLYEEMNTMLKKGGFELLKWTSNCQELLEKIEKEKEEYTQGHGECEESGEELKLKTDEIMKIVGLTWNRSDDSFRYAVKIPMQQSPVTKRKIISDISRLFDPLGWVSPSIILAKIIIQKLWIAGIDWDSEVPSNLLNEWNTYREQLKRLTDVHIPRWIHTKAEDQRVELHGFCDASKVAYAAAVYVRVIDSKGQVHVQLISAKTRVAPVKQVSIPRLELCGAVLLTRLMLEIGKVMNIEKTDLHAWTDSTVVLAWLNSHPSRWKVFVANRVSEILTCFDSQNWSHVSSKQNPADGASRGLQPSELANNSIWFNGPEFLANEVIVYHKPKDVATDLEEVKVHCVTLEQSIWDRFSSLTRMTRVIAYCKRFVSNLSKTPSERYKGYLTTEEMAEALNIVIKQYQAYYFKDEIEDIRKRNNLPKRNTLRALNPFLDGDAILRVGGRLEHSLLSGDAKHPILLPKKCHLTELVIGDAHKQTLHGGPQLMLNYIQAKYFVVGAKQLIRSHYRNCVTCVKHTAPTQTQLMGQLPSARVTPTRAFKCSGVDYAGPIQVRTCKGRGHQSHKGYICLFVCMVTRAVHIEVVTDYTTHGFLQAFKRFVARRGTCTDLWSDNAKNFIGADSELKRLFRIEKNSMLSEVAEALATNGCNWHFIPARSPNFGGLWEAGVKSVKYHLKRVIAESTLTYEEITTVLSQIEACLNSRPQSVINNNPDDMTVLTPGHFLIGEPIITLPDRSYESSNVGSLKRWQYTQKMLQDFWRRWSQEYLTKFYHRYRWASQNPQPKIGDIVVVKEDGLPPCRWLLGKVVETHPGLDKIVRVVTLKVKSGTLKRPVSKLCLLPVATE